MPPLLINPFLSNSLTMSLRFAIAALTLFLIIINIFYNISTKNIFTAIRFEAPQEQELCTVTDPGWKMEFVLQSVSFSAILVTLENPFP